MGRRLPRACHVCGKADCVDHRPRARWHTLRSSRHGHHNLYKSKLWERTARQWIELNPLCRWCEMRGVVREAEQVDHIQPHRGDERLFWDASNWQGLCRSCHARKTGMGK